MQWNGYINYKFCLDNKLSLTQGAVLDSFTKISSWATGKEIEGKIMYKLTAGKLVEELPIISNKKNTFLSIIKQLIEGGFIKREREGNNSYYCLTEVGKTYLGEGVDSNQDKCGFKSSLGVDSNQDNNNTNNNKTNNTIAENVNNLYSLYIKKLPKEKKKYVKSSQAKLYIEQLLKEFSKQVLEGAIVKYYRDTTATYIMAPQYFFSNSKSANAKTYRPFVDYITEERIDDGKELVVTFN